MARVFISYQRADSATFSGRIYDRLMAKFGRKQIFKDVDDIPPGVNFPDYIQTSLRQCSVVVAIIGPRWLGSNTPEGARRLDDVGDFVRLEIETALDLGLIVIPVLVEDARMPSAAELPESLRPLALINAVAVRDDPDFTRDMERLIAAVDRARGRPRPSASRRPAAARREPTPSQPVVQDVRPSTPFTVVPSSPASPPPTVRTVPPPPPSTTPRSAAPGHPAPSRRALYTGVAALRVVVVAFGALLSQRLPFGSSRAHSGATATTTTSGAIVNGKGCKHIGFLLPEKAPMRGGRRWTIPTWTTRKDLFAQRHCGRAQCAGRRRRPADASRNRTCAPCMHPDRGAGGRRGRGDHRQRRQSQGRAGHRV